MLLFCSSRRLHTRLRISDWSSYVCSSYLTFCVALPRSYKSNRSRRRKRCGFEGTVVPPYLREPEDAGEGLLPLPDRKSVVSGKSVSVRVDLGGRRIINKKDT